MFSLVAAALLLLGQVAGVHAAAPAPSTETIVICTPTGLKVVALDGGETDAPSEAQELLCPLCIVAAALPSVAPSCDASSIVAYEAYLASPSPAINAAAAAAPYTARAPPL